MALIRSFNSKFVVIKVNQGFKSNFTVIQRLRIRICIVVQMNMKACQDGQSKQCYCVMSRVSCLLTQSTQRSKYAMHLMLCLLRLSIHTLVFVALTQHLIRKLCIKWPLTLAKREGYLYLKSLPSWGFSCSLVNLRRQLC